MEEQSEFEDDKSVDPSQLDVEATRQTDVFWKWSVRANAAKKEVERQEFAVDVLESKLQLEAREHPEKFKITKVSEAAIKAAVMCHPTYVAAKEAYFEARHVSAMLASAVKTLDQKESMIKELVKMHGQQYFAGPSVPRDLVAEWSKHRQRAAGEGVERQREVVRKRVKAGGK